MAFRPHHNIIIVFFCLILCSSLICQDISGIGVPFVTSYDKEIYNAGIQNWDIDQGKDGLMYFANNDGLLINTGSKWILEHLPNKTVSRSIQVASDGKIYVGGQNEFGYFLPKEDGSYKYTSLIEDFDRAYQVFEDVWDITEYKGQIYFRSSLRIYQYSDNGSKVYSGIGAKYLTLCNDQLIIQTVEGDLLSLVGEEWMPIAQTATDNVKGIVSIGKHKLLVLFEKMGLFILENNELSIFSSDVNKIINNYQGYALANIDNEKYAVATGSYGVLIINNKGDLLSRITKEEGLIANRAQVLFVDETSNLWVGMNKGLSIIYTNSPFSILSPDPNDDGIGYDAIVHENKLYLATDNGLFMKPLEDKSDIQSYNEFYRLSNTEKQTWGLDIIKDELILSHVNGASLIKYDQAELIYEKDGCWLFQEDLYEKNQLLVGGYGGLSYASLNNDILSINSIQNSFDESSRFLVQDENGIVWISHPYRGIYRIDRNTSQVIKLTKQNGLPSDLHNHVFKVNNQVLFCGETGIYAYDESSNTFSSYEKFASFFDSNEKIRRLYESPNGDIWFITSKDVGRLKISNLGLDFKIEKQVFPFLKPMMNDGFERIYVHDNESVIICTTKGFVHFDNKKSKSKNNKKTLKLQAKANTKRSTKALYFESSNKSKGSNKEIELASTFNSLEFNFNVVNFSLNDVYKYRWKLSGYDQEWSDWSSALYKEYTNLKHGKYEFLLDAKGSTDEVLSVALPLNISAAWYASAMAQILFLLLGAGLVFLIYKYNTNTRKALEYKVESTVKKSEQEIKRLENEKIKSQLEHKKRELISTTMNLVQKNETFLNLKQELLSLKKLAQNDQVVSKINATIKLIDKEEANSDNLKQFMFHFNELNGDFVERLQTKYPKLTPKDIKMCSYLRMNLTTKDISKLLNVTIRSVEASRYRLRKKITLDSDDNLNDYFMRY